MSGAGSGLPGARASATVLTPVEGDGFRVEPVEHGAVFTLARPGKLNALTRPMLDGLAACLDALEAGAARLLVITGEGEKAFCAGTDLAELESMSEPARLEKSAMARALFVRLSRSPVTSVAAVNGLAFGGGLEVAMACTFRVAAAHASFSLPEIRLGLLPAYAGTQFLPALVGAGRALELMLTGRRIDAREALAIGLVNRVLDDGEGPTAAALALAREVARMSAPAVEGIRRCVAAAGARVGDAGLAVEDAEVRRVFVSDDAREGVAAFLEKRAPRFNRGG